MVWGDYGRYVTNLLPNALWPTISNLMKKIPLTKGKFAIVDDEDFEYLNRIKWHITTKGYAIHSIKRINIWMHRYILEKHNLYKNGFEVDHINRNRTDNRKINLRICTGSENRVNTTILKRNKSGYKGVFWDKYNKKWEATISFNKKNYFLGLFDDPELASYAYIEKSKELHGEFSIYNNL